MKHLFVLLVLIALTFAHRGALSEDCSTFYINDAVAGDLGISTLTDGQSQKLIPHLDKTTNNSTLCYTPTGLIISGQYAPAGVISIITLPSGQKLQIEWVAHGIEITDASTKSLTAGPPDTRLFPNVSASLVR
jgi:hypothetical protein